MQFGISGYFEPIPAALGGVLLGSCVIYKAALTGDILGVSASTRGLMAKGPSRSRVLFLLGLVFSGACAAFVDGFALEPALPTDGGAELWIRFGVAGFLVGFGTSLGNGCTSGHGLTGLARLGFRSWVGVPTFMGFAVLTATTTGTARVLHPHAAAEADAPTTGLGATVVAAGVALLLITGAALWGAFKGGASGQRLKEVAELLAGGLFGTGLLVSGMARPSKVAGFVDMGSGAWDPSLAFVMCGALALTFVFYQLVHARMPQPLLGGDFSQFPNVRKMPDRDLFIGTACFGIGWGLAGTCPGPMWVLLGARPSLPLLLFVVDTFAGVAAWMLYKSYAEKACNNKEVPAPEPSPEGKMPEEQNRAHLKVEALP